MIQVPTLFFVLWCLFFVAFLLIYLEHTKRAKRITDDLRENVLFLKYVIDEYDAHMLKMQSDGISYLSPAYPDRNSAWFISRMLHHLDGPAQRVVQKMQYNKIKKPASEKVVV